jgi:hypothetical protein
MPSVTKSRTILLDEAFTASQLDEIVGIMDRYRAEFDRINSETRRSRTWY